MSDIFKNFIEQISPEFIPVIDSRYTKEDYIKIDLSMTNVDLETIDVSSSRVFEGYLKGYIAKNKVKVAYGGYNEVRAIYSRSPHFNQQNPETERNIHLGLDIWCDSKTKILAPLDGKIHSFKNNNNFGDYGPTIILEHTFDNVVFYTLYGHLSLTSLSGIAVGDKVKAGQTIAVLGTSLVNGDYAPHLHFQIIKDMQDNIGDYPGVSSRKNLEMYLQNCPDPNLLLKI